jgi:catechol 2,3-dioxygenase-like lactoylglutathione lyase family enzyme
MPIRRVVPNFQTSRLEESREFYTGFLHFHVEMDLGWIVTFSSRAHPTAQLSVLTADLTAPVHPDVTMGVDDVDALYAEAVRRGLPILYPLTDEPWGVRRFFVRDPNGRVINLMTHPHASG